MDKASAIDRGYARKDADEKRLKAAGVKIVYRGDKGETIGKFRLRKGERLAVVGLGAFGESRKAIVDAIDVVHSMGATVMDIEFPKLRSDRDGARMLHIAMTPRRLSPQEAAEMQEKAVAARVAGRMPEIKARRIWFGPGSVLEKVARCHGWSQRALYNKFGSTNAPAGRRPK